MKERGGTTMRSGNEGGSGGKTTLIFEHVTYTGIWSQDLEVSPEDVGNEINWRQYFINICRKLYTARQQCFRCKAVNHKKS